MAEVSQQQVLDLLYEIRDGMDRFDAKLDEVLALTKTIIHEAELGRQRIAEAKLRYHEKATSP